MSSSARPTTGCTRRSSSRATTASCNSSPQYASSLAGTYEPLLLRQLFRGRVWNAVATLAVADGVLWLPPGAPYAIGNDLFGDWVYESRAMGAGQLRVTPPDADYSVFLFTHDDGSFRGWYVNLEQPQVQTPLGFDYEDELLDIWVAEGSDPELLDEDELEEAVRRGFLDPRRAAEIRTKAERLLAAPPWPTGWESWQPEPGWQLPELPPEWERL